MRKTIFKSARSLCGAVALIALLISVLSFTPLKNQPNFSFAYLSDLHIAEGAGSIEDLNACVADINSNKALKFAIIAGDITDFGSDKELKLAKSI